MNSNIILQTAENCRRLGNINGFTGGNFAYMVYDKDWLSPTINTCRGGGTQPFIVIRIERQ